jgi:2-polyprenyl-3-methyl-5-hydroxy-6-metoxy-1,4-benzoquinol methylase
MNHNAVDFVKQKLLEFTGLSPETLQLLLGRKVYPTFKEEWDFWSPKNETEIQFFYVSNRSYLFGNAVHILPEAIFDDINVGESVLDFGGGSGNYSVPLAFKGCNVSYFDINILQREFVKYMSDTSPIDIHILKHDIHYMPLFDKKFDAILALDVLEHIPNYPDYIERFAKSLKNNGRIYVFAPFGVTPHDPTHLEDTYGLTETMNKNGIIFDEKIPVNNGATGVIYRNKL